MLLSVSEFIGRFHPVLVHLPIGVLLLALVLHWVSARPGYSVPPAVMKLVWWIGIATALVACITGYLLSINEEYEEDTVTVHMWLGISVAALSLLVASNVFLRKAGFITKACSILLFLLIMLTGHFGGTLTHGSDYLTAAWKADEQVNELPVKQIANVQEANVYADVIQPLLQVKCYSCHAQKKQKGKLRLDNPEFIMKGGKNGEVVVAGNAEESELVKRLLLPLQEDHHMPPKQKPQLKESQVNLIHWWIDEGCSFDKKVKELPQPDKIKTLLSALENKGGEEKQVIQLLPESPVEAADQKAVEALKGKGVIIMPVAQGSNYLVANFVTAPAFGDGDITMLLPLKKQLVSLKAGSTNITDESLKTIAGFKNLISVQLNNTRITDKGIAQLQLLLHLQSLNLVNTDVSVSGVSALKGLKKLRNLYVYKTKVTGAHYAELKKSFPGTVIDTGGYTLQSLPSDTIYLTKPK